ncbi:hypothetical protein PFISCL1PPCAC_17658, partial [Pristionchus fissidentatus]
QENKFFWRSAVSNNVLDDLHIGAYQPQENVDIWQWVDDNRNISDGVYDNFVGGFPIPGIGSCTAMLIESPAANWINEDCDSQKLPFVCRRAVLKTPDECPKNAPAEGQDIFAPGFPNPTTPCEFTLFVDPKSLVQLEIVNLEANPNLDFLEVYEGATGLNLLANLSGTNPNPSTYATKSSNVMRVNWKPN